MKRIEIFKAGLQISSSGKRISFSEDDLKKAANNYNTEQHEAPLVVGHPKGDDPAYGWVQGLEYSDGSLYANVDQVDDEFSELVEKGRFKKVSASFYEPNSPINPFPGAYTLRHVGFLGAQPPAVKGLKPIEFNDSDEDIISFGDIEDSIFASLFKGLRDYIIDKDGLDVADQVIPKWEIDHVSNRIAANKEKNLSHSFQENKTNQEESEDMPNDQESAAKQTADLDKRTADLEKREAEFAEKQAKLSKNENEAFIKGLQEEGKLTAATSEGLADFMQTLDDGTVSFSEEGKDDVSSKDFFKDFLKKLPVAVDFSEKSGNEEAFEAPETPDDIAAAAVNYQEEQAKAGRSITVSEAVTHVTKGQE